MRHRIKKIRFKKGKNSTVATLKKLLYNFLDKGKIETTLTKAKVLRSLVDSLVHKAQDRKKSHENILLKYLGSRKLVDKLFNTVGPEFKDRKSGFSKSIRLGRRVGDGAEMVRLEWIRPIFETQPASGKEEPVSKRKSIEKKTETKLKVGKKSREKLNKINKTSKRKRN